MDNTYNKSNKCNTFLQPRAHTYTQVNTSDELNVGVLYASRKIFDLGVKYARDMAITIATAEVTILMEASLTSIDHFFDKLDENKRIKEIINSDYSKIMSLFESSIDIIRFMAYNYLTKSWNNFATTNKSYTDIEGNLTQDGVGFQKMLGFVNDLSNNNIQIKRVDNPHPPNNNVDKGKPVSSNIKTAKGGTIGESNDKMFSALRIVNRLTDDIMKLPREVQEDELLKITDMLKNKINKQSGGWVKKERRTTKKFRDIRKMIKRSMRKFSKGYSKLY
jgi:hypothetical protein